jgi:hypothetical protein
MNFDRSINELSRNFDPIGSKRALIGKVGVVLKTKPNARKAVSIIRVRLAHLKGA